MEFIGYFASILIGISLGMTGSGGSILTVPVLVYFFGIDPSSATTYSLCIVGIASLSGSVNFFLKKMIDFRVVTLFGIPSIASVYIARRYILPNIPGKIGCSDGWSIEKNDLLMALFSISMFFSALSMLRKPGKNIAIPGRQPRYLKCILLAGSGILVGLITGLLGAGGGFLIIPVLVLLVRLPIKKAIATSLTIIAVNSILGFSFSVHDAGLNWFLFSTITAIVVAGIFIGNRLAVDISTDILKKWLGLLLLVISLAIFVKVLS
jgi:uncharacterized protein